MPPSAQADPYSAGSGGGEREVLAEVWEEEADARRPAGHRPSDRHTPEVARLSGTEELSRREIARRLGVSKTTVNEILLRWSRQAPGSGSPGL